MTNSEKQGPACLPDEPGQQNNADGDPQPGRSAKRPDEEVRDFADGQCSRSDVFQDVEKFAHFFSFRFTLQPLSPATRRC